MYIRYPGDDCDRDPESDIRYILTCQRACVTAKLSCGRVISKLQKCIPTWIVALLVAEKHAGANIRVGRVSNCEQVQSDLGDVVSVGLKFGATGYTGFVIFSPLHRLVSA